MSVASVTLTLALDLEEVSRSNAVTRPAGLDPAGPLFEGRGPEYRLDPTDAGYVEVVHSDGGYLGYAQPTGHADFYPRGGMHVLAGCEPDSSGEGPSIHSVISHSGC